MCILGIYRFGLGYCRATQICLAEPLQAGEALFGICHLINCFKCDVVQRQEKICFPSSCPSFFDGQLAGHKLLFDYLVFIA
jgi:hypothetical protein